MVMSATQTHFIMSSATSAEGGVDQIKRSSKLISDMRSTVPDFKDHAAAYTQLAKYLTKDENCTTDDVVKALNAIKDALKANGKDDSDANVMLLFNKFKTMYQSDVAIQFLFQKADLSADDITELLCKFADNNFTNDDMIAYLQGKPEEKTNYEAQRLPVADAKPLDLRSNRLSEYLDALGKNNQPIPNSTPVPADIPDIDDAIDNAFRQFGA